MTHAVRIVWYPLVDNGWNRRFHVSRYLCAPTSFLLHFFGGSFCGSLESNFDRLHYGDNVDARDLAKRIFWAFSNTVYCWLVFTRKCNLVFHCIVFRGFEDSGPQANHCRFRGVLVHLPPDILA